MQVFHYSKPPGGVVSLLWNKEDCYKVAVVQWLSSKEMDTATRVQILDETDCLSHSTNTLEKGMNPIILPPAMGK